MKRFRRSPVSLIFIVLAVSLAVSAKATPVRARVTLLSLYAKSDAIMIGRFDKREDSGTNRVDNGYTIVTTKTYFDISTVLKGEPTKFVVVENEEFRYQVSNGDEAPRDAVFSVGPILNDSSPKPGDTVLLFLKNDGDSLILADESDGVKKLSASDQGIYVDRIKELNSIFEKGEADSSKIAAWLVRCAEEASTRWDGTHELMQGFRHLEWREQKDHNGYERIDPSVSYSNGLEAAKVLSPDLKNALTQILVNSDFNFANSGELSEGDLELVALVKRWDPKAAAAYLLDRLKSQAFSTHENAGIMYKISELIDNSRSAELTRSYRRSASDETVTSGPIKKGCLNKILESFVRIAESAISTQDAIMSN